MPAKTLTSLSNIQAEALLGVHAVLSAMLCTASYISVYDVIQQNIMKTQLYNFDPIKPNFYTVKLGFTGVYIIFLISAHNIDCGYPLEPPHPGGSNEYPQFMF